MAFYSAGTPTPNWATAGKIPVAPSNYFRSPSGPAETVGKGRQFVVVSEEADTLLGRPPQRGDRMIDSRLEIMAIDEVREMYDFGGEVIGYRIQVEQ